ncbi:phosphoglucosamine mutase [Phragmitibacter flavus]|uniref:Phosphoglucosamine mutase n=2 Tax=Phragmitibacter flavus TaxID=2576071 RepID=A0A5R8K7N2_9BACT|nr:phosphoglucosamine mutase [Phragmitibacter flavus]
MAAKKRKYFGTDGVRGVANQVPMTPEFVLRLGQAAAQVLVTKTRGEGRSRPRCVIGKDTRCSGGMLEAALTAGLNSAGVDVVLCGVLPTPGVAYLVTQEKADFGAVISASHNPFYDNGVKFVGGDGYKLTDEQELAIEAAMEVELTDRVRNGEVGGVSVLADAQERYIQLAIGSMQGRRLDGLRIALDNANGAASVTSTEALRRLGAEVQVFHSSPDGVNINENCGCTHGEIIEGIVKSTGVQVGVSHDGDADRVLLCDETGSRLSGDELIAVAAASMLRKGTLNQNTVVATVMSNYGLDELINGLGGRVIRTGVGDRYVIAAMRAQDLNFGAEESGHIVFRDHVTTGDGLIAALQVLRIMMETGEPLSELRKVLTPFPQVKRNLRVKAKPPEEELVKAQALVVETEQKLGGLGRVLLRYSGTEPLIRLLVEGRDPEYIERQADRIVEAIREQIGE